MRALYIHGFNSAGFGNKVDGWREVFGPDSVINPTLPVQPRAAIALLSYLVEKLQGPDFCLLGSSLGGYYALWLARRYRVPTLLINPAVQDVAAGLAYAKDPITNYKTDETYCYTPDDFAALSELELQAADWPHLQGHVYAYLDAEDEVLPAPQIAELLKSKGLPVTLYPGGNHRFEHLAEAIADFKSHLQHR